MKRILALLCVLALVLSVVPAAAFAAEYDLQAEINANAEEIIVLEADASNVTVNRDTYLDLNGHDLDGVTVLAGTLYCMDSQTADYTVADGVYGHVTNVNGAVKAAEGYLQVGDSFHAVNLDIYAMTLRAADVGVYYKSHFAADEVVAEQVESFGVALSVVTAPNASNLETYCGYSQFTGFEAGEGANSVGTSTLLKGIMKAANGDEKNAKNAAMPVYGRAYIKTSEGYFFGETVKRSLQEQVEAIDGIWEGLTDSQKAPVLGMLEAYASVMENWNISNIQGIQTPGVDSEIEIPIEVAAENGIVTEAVTVEQNGVAITVPAGVKLAEGVSALTLTVTPKEESDTGLTLEKDEVLMPMDVHVEGLAADNTQPLTISLGKVMPENLNMGNYTVYHVENGKANEMTLIPVDAQFTAHNQYKYTLDGEVILYVANFSLFAMRSNTTNTWNGEIADGFAGGTGTQEDPYIIRNADQLAYFSKAVGGMEELEPNDFAGEYVKLVADIDLGDAEENNDAEKIFYPIGYYNSTDSYTKVSGGSVSSSVSSFEGTFDGTGHTIKNFYQNTWEMFGDYNNGYSGTPNHYKDAMGLFGFVRGGTVQNLTVENFSSDGEFTPTGVIAAYADGNATFKNIALFNCNPRVYNTGNAGIVGWDNGGDTEAEASSFIFENITIDKTNKISALWGSWDVGCAGVLGYLGAYSKAHFENCNIAAKIDVNNDVCANYQYYWYRYCGMLIGTVDKTKTENGLTVLDLSNITAENTTVNFGDWNDYYYCELVANSLASYTYDHQFSRLEPIASIDDIKSGNEWTKTGNFLLTTDGENECYHIVNKDGVLTRHFHADSGYETTDVDKNGTVDSDLLMEDKFLVNLPFNQVFGGYGWGVKGTQVSELGGITVKGITAGTQTDSAERFIGKENVWVVAGEKVSVGYLFGALAEDIRDTSVQVSVTDPNNVVTATYEANESDWTKGTITFDGAGIVKVTITDYLWCIPTTITVEVKADYSGDYYIAALRNSEKKYYYMTNDLGNAATNRYQATAIEGDLLTGIALGDSNKTFKFVKVSENTYKICAYDKEPGYLFHSGTSNSGNYKSEEEALELIVELSASANGTVNVHYTGEDQERYLALNGTTNQNYFAFYKGEMKDLVLIPVEAVNACLHTNTRIEGAIDATCTEQGYTGNTVCNACGTTVSEGTAIDVLEHELVNGKCINEGCDYEENQEQPEPDEGEEGWTLVTDVSTLKAGDQLIIGAVDTNKGDFVAGDISNSIMASIDAVIESEKIASKPESAVVLTLGGSAGAWTLTNESGKLLGATAVKKVAWGDGTTTWTISIEDGNATIQNETSSYGRLLYNVTSPRFTTYTSGTSASMVLPQLYRLKTTGGSTEPETPVCEHANTTETVEDATCTAKGSTVVICDDCEKVISETEIPMLDHDYENGVCTVCGAKDPNAEEPGDEPAGEETIETMNITGATGTLVSDSSSISWTSGDVTFTNTKGSTAIRTSDSDHFRLYANSGVTVSVGSGNITKIVFTCTSGSYATALKGSIADEVTVSGSVVTVSGSVVTVILSNPGTSYEITKITAQTRISKMEVTYTK